MKTLTLYMITRAGIVDNFNLKPGFVALADKDDSKIIAVTSGWFHSGINSRDDQYFVYRKVGEQWKGNWEDQETFPVNRIQRLILEWKLQNKALDCGLNNMPESCSDCELNNDMEGYNIHPCGQQNCWYSCTACSHNQECVY